MGGQERYQLRYAAGRYWLLDMNQQRNVYKRPMSMNAMGARIWEMLQKGLSDSEIAANLSLEYDADEKEILQDVLEFRQQLAGFGVDV